MTNEELEKEIARLRDDLAALKAKSKEPTASPTERSPGQRDPFAHMTKDELFEHLNDLSTAAEKALKQSNPLVLMAAFVLGLIFGKLFSR